MSLRTGNSASADGRFSARPERSTGVMKDERRRKPSPPPRQDLADMSVTVPVTFPLLRYQLTFDYLYSALVATSRARRADLSLCGARLLLLRLLGYGSENLVDDEEILFLA
jgi:hypothetical protein